MVKIVAELNRQFMIAFNGIYDLIDHCPDDLWTAKCGGYLFAQHILHVIVCSFNYLRYKGDNDDLSREIMARKELLEPGLANAAAEVLSKQELRELYNKFRKKVEKFFFRLDEKIFEDAYIVQGSNNFGLVLMEIRHYAYHAGQLDSFIRDRGLKSPGWGYMA